MAQTVKIEIPITAKDDTGAGVQSAQRRFNSLERSIEKTQKQMDRMSRGRHNIHVDAKDDASQKIASIEDAVNKAGKKDATVEVGADDAASGVLNSISDTVSELNGDEAVVDVEAEDAATGVISDVGDELGELHGEQAVTEVSANDSATGVINGIRDALESLNGQEAVVDIQAGGAGSGAISQAADTARTPIAETAAVMGASFGVYDSVSTYAGFEQAMSQVSAISGATGKNLEDLTEKAEYMGATTKFTATESAEAFNYMAMAGWKTKDMLGGIEGIMNLAAASGENLGTTSDIVTDALTAFGLSASDSTHFADVMAQASANANTNVSMLGESFKYVAPVAGAMKYSIEDTALALGLMANAGVKSSMSGTALRRAITALASPTDKEAEAFERYGISLMDSEGHQKSLNDVMHDLRTNLSGLADDEKTAAVSAMFGNQALAGMLAIINASEQDFDKLSAAVNDADGASKEMADTMIDNMQGSFTLMQSAIEGVENSLGKRLAPYMRSLADGITESMPEATKAIEGVMDTIDTKVGHIKDRWATMISSDDWKNAGIGGKINQAFDTMIAQPVSKWAKGRGGNVITSTIGGLFSDAFKIMPGGEKAGLTSWLSAGILAKGATTGLPLIKKGIDGIGTAVGLFSTNAASAVPVVAGLTAAFGGLAFAANYMNDKLTNLDLEKHMGNVKLSDKQAADVAEKILDAKWGVNVDLALDKINGADKLREEAKNALEENDALEYKSHVGIELTADEQSTYMSNIETFINNSLEELGNRTYAAKITVDTMLSTPEGGTLSSAIDKWALEDTIEMNNLSAQLTAAVNSALEDGIIGADEEQAINLLQMKINNIMNGWREAEAQAGMDLINEKYGSLSGKDLEAGSFKKVVEELQTQRETNDADLDEASLDFHTFLNAADKSGRLQQDTGRTKGFFEKQFAQAMAYARAGEMQNSIDFENQTLGDTYTSSIRKGSEQVQSNTDSAISKMQSFAPGTLQLVLGSIMSGMQVTGADKGLKDLYNTMKPDVQAYEEVIDSYREQFGKVPKDIMESYNQAIETGAAAGDKDAAMNVLTKQIAQSDDQTLKDEVMNLPVGNILREGLERQMAELDENPPTISGVTAELEDPEVALKDADAIQDRIGNVMKSVTDTGSSASYDGTVEGITITLGDVEVDGESAAEHVAEALGMTLDELAETTGTTTEELEAGATITIPADKITTDHDQLESAVNEATQGAMEETSGDAGTVEATADVEVDAGNVDKSGLDEGIQQAAQDADNPTVTTKADAKVETGEVDASGAKQETEEAAQNAFDQTIQTDGTTDVTITKASDNIDAVYNQVGNEIKSKFSQGYSASANLDVSIHVNYSIANPSKTVTFSGAGSGSGTITANAEGGFVDGAELSLIGEDGPEFVIPVGSKRRRRGAELWAKAGEALGMFRGIPKYADGGAIGIDEDSLNVTPFEKRQGAQGDVSGLLGSNPTNSSPVPLSTFPAAVGNPQQASGDTNTGVNVDITMSPVIQVEGGGMNEESLADTIKNRIMELADDVAYEIGEKISQAFGNMPIATEEI